MSVEDRLACVLEEHFDPNWGSGWWLERGSELGFDARREIRCVEDLDRLPPIPRAALASLPIEHFVPRRLHERRADWIVSETGGTTGAPARTVFLAEEFEEAFVAPFVAAAARMGFPRERSWLYLGPSGPHVIGKAARACARALGAMDPFAVDLDPRWVRRLPPGSLARQRYTAHVLSQAEAILESQDVGVLFATPPLIAALGERLPREVRHAIAGVHLGGMAAPPDFWKQLDEQWFPEAVALGGYGNSLAGVCPQITPTGPGGPEYFPHGDRLVLEVIGAEASGRGRVRFHRLDRAALLPGMLERDEAGRAVHDGSGEDGFRPLGVRDPRPAETEAPTTGEGLY
ncbi:MAG: phenazine biosynthesis protein [Deltaproteobacteria bacterium]|nr:phenazine biosynthesis protein [Deltaproteobacteria bacterium]MBW2446902.1 phenazine biosynthesis protein [Deltaproteobacteria bacterium]